MTDADSVQQLPAASSSFHPLPSISPPARGSEVGRAVLRVGGDGDQGHGPLGDGRTLANWWSTATAPANHDAAAPPAKTSPEERELLTIKQLVAYSTLSERTLRGYLKRRLKPLPHYRVDKKILIRRSEFDDWLANFRYAEKVDEITQAVDEMLTGLTGHLVLLYAPRRFLGGT